MFGFGMDPESQGYVGRLGSLFYTAARLIIVKFNVLNEELIRDPKTGMNLPRC